MNWINQIIKLVDLGNKRCIFRAQNDQPIRSGATVQHPEPFTAGASAGVSDAGTWPLKPRQRICKWCLFHIYVPLYTRFIYHYIPLCSGISMCEWIYILQIIWPRFWKRNQFRVMRSKALAGLVKLGRLRWHLMSHIHLAQVCEASMHPLNLLSYLV